MGYIWQSMMEVRGVLTEMLCVDVCSYSISCLLLFCRQRSKQFCAGTLGGTNERLLKKKRKGKREMDYVEEDGNNTKLPLSIFLLNRGNIKVLVLNI